MWNEQLPRSKIFWLILTGLKQWKALCNRKREEIDRVCGVWSESGERVSQSFNLWQKTQSATFTFYTHRKSRTQHRAKGRIVSGNGDSNRNCNSMVGITFGYANEFLSKYLKLLTFTTLFIEVSIKIVFFSIEVSRWDVLHKLLRATAVLHYCNAMTCVCIPSKERTSRRYRNLTSHKTTHWEYLLITFTLFTKQEDGRMNYNFCKKFTIQW